MPSCIFSGSPDKDVCHCSRYSWGADPPCHCFSPECKSWWGVARTGPSPAQSCWEERPRLVQMCPAWSPAAFCGFLMVCHLLMEFVHARGLEQPGKVLDLTQLRDHPCIIVQNHCLQSCELGGVLFHCSSLQVL